jgi:hypothetical protein
VTPLDVEAVLTRTKNICHGQPLTEAQAILAQGTKRTIRNEIVNRWSEARIIDRFVRVRATSSAQPLKQPTRARPRRSATLARPTAVTSRPAHVTVSGHTLAIRRPRRTGRPSRTLAQSSGMTPS